MVSKKEFHDWNLSASAKHISYTRKEEEISFEDIQIKFEIPLNIWTRYE